MFKRKAYKPKQRAAMPRQRKADPVEHATTTAEHGREIAAALLDAIRTEKPEDADILTLYAHRLRLCNNNNNLWSAEDLHTENPDDPGEPNWYNGAGRLWPCGQKLCPGCMQRAGNRHRAALRRILDNQTIDPNDPSSRKGLRSGHHFKFLTLTIVNPGLSLMDTRWIVDKAWSNFRKRKYFEEVMIGGVKSEEFTLTKNGAHYHIHQLVRSRSIWWDKYRADWTSCVKFAYDEYNRLKMGKPIHFNVATEDGMLIVEETPLSSVESGVREVAKYITKSDSWHRLRPNDLLDVVRIERWPRMFEFFGSFRRKRRTSSDDDGGALTPAGLRGEEKALSNEKEVEDKTILDTTLISDLDPVVSWRKKAARLGMRKYLEKLEMQIIATRRLRIISLKEKFPFANFTQHGGEPWINIDEIVNQVNQIYIDAGRPPPKPTRQLARKIGIEITERQFTGQTDLPPAAA